MGDASCAPGHAGPLCEWCLDARTYWDTPSVFKRGFDMDWARIDSERFWSTVLPYKVEGEAQPEGETMQVDAQADGEQLWLVKWRRMWIHE